MKTLGKIAFLILCLMLTSLMPVTSAQALSVDAIRFSQNGDKMRLMMHLDSPTDFRAFVLASPYRIIIDLPRFDWKATTIEKPQGFMVSDVRQGPLQDGISRIVFDLPRAIVIENAGQNKKDKNTITLDFSIAAPKRFEAQKNKVFGNLKIEEPTAPDLNKVISGLTQKEEGFLKPASLVTTQDNNTQNPTPRPTPDNKKPQALSEEQKPLIVIDPGHGGVDPGSLGATGEKEKNVVLALGFALRDALIKSGRYRVEMTRTKDIFIPLGERVAFARKHQADLFISIHADSIHKPEIHGSSVYTLSKEASDAQTAKLAEKENKADLIAGIDLKVDDEQVAFILGDFLMTETLNQSKFFANTIVKKMKNNGVSVLDNTHRYAGFAVLKAPDVPSVLVEAGFMSNKTEAELLSQSEHRNRISAALKAGIDTYFDHLQQGKTQE